MKRFSPATRKHQAKLKRHYQKNFAAAVLALDDCPDIPIEEFCWMALSWQTSQMVADIGTEEAAIMFENWAKLIRDRRFGKFNGTQMSKMGDLDESLIY